MEQVLHWAGDHWAHIAIALSLIIQISPIKVNPWTAIFNWLGRALTKELKKDIDGIGKDVSDLKKSQEALSRKVDKNEMNRMRHEVLGFANSCKNKQRHTKEEFDHIFELNDQYMALLERSGEKNGQFEEAFSFIKVLYRRCMEENDFL